MKYVAILVSVFLAGCATSSVSPYGKDTYLMTVEHGLGTTQKAILRARAAKEANAYCAGMGKQMNVQSAEDKGIAWLTSTSSQLIFTCT